MPFFSDSGFQPKRAFRFLVTFSQLGDLTFMVKTAKKPSYKMETKSHQILNHQFNFPGIIKWEPLDVTFIDAVDPNVGSRFYSTLIGSGYVPPTNHEGLLTGITKAGTTATIGEVRIKQLDGGGAILAPGADPNNVDAQPSMILEEWTLKNAFITSVKFGDQLGYDKEDLINVTVSLTYDFATYEPYPNGKAYKAG